MKIIGIGILVLLGLLLSILLLVLLVPVRYSLSGSFYGKPKGKVKVTWLLHAISIKATYEKKLDVSVWVLGIRLFQKKVGKEEVKEELKDELEKAEEELKDGLEEVGEELEELYEPIEDDKPSESEWEVKEEMAQDMAVQEIPGASEQTENLSKPAEEVSSEDLSKKPKKSRKKKDFGQHKKKKSDFQGSVSEKKLSIEEYLKQTLDSWKEKWNQLKEYKEKFFTFWNDEKNQETIRLIIRQLKAMTVHVLPRKVKGKAVFGFDDPETTGKVLQALSVAYVWYGDAVEIVPVFDRKIFEAEGSLKGRVRAGTLAAQGFRILLNKNFRRLVKCWLKNGGREDGR